MRTIPVLLVALAFLVLSSGKLLLFHIMAGYSILFSSRSVDMLSCFSRHSLFQSLYKLANQLLIHWKYNIFYVFVKYFPHITFCEISRCYHYIENLVSILLAFKLSWYNLFFNFIYRYKRRRYWEQHDNHSKHYKPWWCPLWRIRIQTTRS